MNSRERILAAARGQRPDMPPVAPYMGNHGARVAGVRLRDYYTDPKQLATAQLRAWEMYHQDVIVAQSDNYYMAEAFGCLIDYHEDSIPTMKKTRIETLHDVAGLTRPDPSNDGRMPVFLEGIRLLRETVGDEVAIRGCGTGSFVMAGHLMGPERFLTELAHIHSGNGGDEPALLALFDLLCDTLIDFAVLQLEAGATIVQCADSLASLDVISPGMYRKYVFPYEKKFFDAIKPHCRQHDAVCLLHICGDNTEVFPDFARLGADIIAVDHKSNLAEAKRVMGTKACLIGNLDPSSVLLFGSPDDVRREAKVCLQKAAGDGGYILGSGCEVAMASPKENIQAMIETARDYKYESEGSPRADNC